MFNRFEPQWLTFFNDETQSSQCCTVHFNVCTTKFSWPLVLKSFKVLATSLIVIKTNVCTTMFIVYYVNIYGFLTHKTWIRQVWYVESVLLTMRNSSKVLCDFFFTSTILGMYKNRKHFYFCFHASETLKASPSMTSLYTVHCTVYSKNFFFHVIRCTSISTYLTSRSNKNEFIMMHGIG